MTAQIAPNQFYLQYLDGQQEDGLNTLLEAIKSVYEFYNDWFLFNQVDAIYQNGSPVVSRREMNCEFDEADRDVEDGFVIDFTRFARQQYRDFQQQAFAMAAE